MSDGRDNNGWRGVALVALTYVYFLIFAQFGFLRRLAELGITEAALPAMRMPSGRSPATNAWIAGSQTGWFP